MREATRMRLNSHERSSMPRPQKSRRWKTFWHPSNPLSESVPERSRSGTDLTRRLEGSHHDPPHQAATTDPDHRQDRKSTRLNSSHVAISYAVFCLKKKNKNIE